MAHVTEIRKKLSEAKKNLRKAQRKHVSEAGKQKKHLQLAHQHGYEVNYWYHAEHKHARKVADLEHELKTELAAKKLAKKLSTKARKRL